MPEHKTSRRSPTSARAGSSRRLRVLLILGVGCVAVGGSFRPAAAAAPGAASAVAPGAASATTANFSTSFEPSDPPLGWTSTAETDSGGNPQMSGISGTAACLSGSIMSHVVAVTASGENPPSEVAAALTDCDVNTKWLAFSQPTTATPVWIQYQLDSPQVVTRYSMSAANDTPTRDPQDWQVQGSPDGTTWTAVDTQTTQSFAARFATNTYNPTNTTAYTYYRLNITANHTDPDTQLSEWQLSAGGTAPPPAEAMRSDVGTGPVSVWNTKSTVGWTGLHALRYAGSMTAGGHVYAYNKLYDVNIPVTPTTSLAYTIFPEFTSGSASHPSAYAAVDLEFSDGSVLRNLGAIDQHGYSLDAQAQGASKSLYVNQWNAVSSTIGQVAAGKTITRVLVDYDNASGVAGAAFQGWIDDINIIGTPAQPALTHLSDRVITTRGTEAGGTFSRGNNIPAAATPHGFNLLTPMTQAGSTSFFYNYTSDNDANNLPTLQALEVSHEPSPWMGDRTDFQVMPSGSGSPDVSRTGRALEFSHANEVARPYYYGVDFTNGIRAEMTPTDHSGLFRFTYTGSSSSVIFDEPSTSGLMTLEMGTGSTTPDGVVTGYSDNASGLSTGSTRMFFYGKLLLQPDQSITGGGTPSSTTGAGGPNVTRYISVDTTTDKVVTMEFATSLISLAQAQHNLALEVGSTDTFDTIKSSTQAAWDKNLGVISVQGATADQLTSLYSNLYRLNLYPNEAHENVGSAASPQYQYASPTAATTGAATPTQTNAAVVSGTMYVDNGFWDTYRTEWPLDSWLYPSQTGKMIDGFTRQYVDGGWISRWSSPGYANLMTGTSADDSFTDAYLNGVRNFDWRSMYDAVVKDATVYSANVGTGRNGQDTAPFVGYTSTATSFGMSWAMAGYASDYGIANMSQALCDDPALATDPKHQQYCDNAPYFRNRAQQYVNLWDPALYDPALGASSNPLGFFIGKSAAGVFRQTPGQYDPQAWGTDYTEADGWTMAFSVPTDPQGLAALMGGQSGLAAKLDQYFAVPECACKGGSYGGTIHEAREASQTQMGQYEFNNQPGHAVPYFYDVAGQPSKTQAIVRETLARMFVGNETGAGYPGDEDNGEMSGWYILSALGFYPLTVGGTDMAVGSPLFQQATVHLENGQDLVINAPANSTRNVYVQGMTVSGQAWNKSYVPRSVLTTGGVIDFAMGPNPSSWATDPAASPSTITPVGGAVPTPAPDVATPSGGTATGSTNTANSVAALFDDTSKTQVNFSGPVTGTTPTDPTVQYQFITPQTIGSYTLTSGSDTNQGDPTAWTLSGSNNGSAWTVLDQRADQTFPWRQQTRPFSLAQSANFSYYKLEVTANNGKPTTGISELELLAVSTAPTAAIPENIAGWPLVPVAGMAVLVLLRRRRRPGMGSRA